MFENVFNKENIEVLINSDRGIFTREKIDGICTYLEWDDRYGETSSDEIFCSGYSIFTVDNGFRVGGYPECENIECHIAKHLFALLDYCGSKKITFYNSSGDTLESIINAALLRGLNGVIEQKSIDGYLQKMRS